MFHAVVLAYGATRDNRLNIPNEALPGIYSAREFVGWYNGMPHHTSLPIRLDNTDTAVVIGHGNVALDVARLLTTPVDTLRKTDMAEEALDALSSSRIRHVRVLGRRGPLQASFTTKELRAMLSIPRTRVELVPLDAADGMSSEDRSISRLLQVMQQFPHQQSDYDKRLSIEFYTSPQRFLGKERVEGLQARQTVVDVNGRVQLTDRVDTLACQLAVKSIGYACEPVGGVPWDAEHSVVPNDHGRVLSEGSPVPGLFVAGWLKRGPKGVINTTMVDAWETADAILSDTLPQPHIDPKDLVLHNRVFTFDDWLKLDAWENEQGTCMGKVRTKITSMDDMLRLLNRI